MIECVLKFSLTCKEIGVELENEHWNEQVPKLVEIIPESKVTILWSQQDQTDKTIPNHEPDIEICDHERGKCMLIMFQFQETEM
jgi:hypothetical protein